MPRKQIYVREEDEKVFERAVELAGEESLSATVAEAVRRFVEQEEAKAEGFRQVVVTIGDENNEWRKVRFEGRLLAEGSQQRSAYFQAYGTRFWPGVHPTRDRDTKGLWESFDYVCLRQLYLTKKGKLFLYTAEYKNPTELTSAEYRLFDSLEEVKSADGVRLEFLEMAAAALGEELIEDLDI